MKYAASAFVMAALMYAGSTLSFGQSPPATSNKAPAQQAVVTFQLERPGIAVPRFTLEVREDGTGTYRAEEVQNLSGRDTVHYAKPEDVDRALTLSSSTTTKIFRLARTLHYFQINCASTKKNIADTGKKTLSYAGTDGAGACIYNYSDNKDVMALTDTFLAIAYTLDEGRRLQFLHRYDRLGLDAETISLEDAVKEGRARELGTIAPALDSIAQDPAVMNRVRKRVAGMLKEAASEKDNKF
ncbi:MAG TPA: hypothetical protein VFE38_04915 [Edaphobacter sp.]|nr:hypothetical protein [Edaphobacter sp.]